MREDRGADDVGIAVDGVRTPDHRDRDMARGRVQRGGIERVGRLQPIGRQGAVVAAGAGIAAVEHRAQPVGPHIGGRDRGDVRLDRLPDLILDRHFREQIGDARIDGWIVGHGARELRPDFGMDHAGDGRRLRFGRADAGAQREGREPPGQAFVRCSTRPPIRRPPFLSLIRPRRCAGRIPTFLDSVVNLRPFALLHLGHIAP